MMMSLSARDRQALDEIEAELAGDAPKLASMLTAFTRLAAGENMPAPETIRWPGHRLAKRILTSRNASLALWLLVTVALIAMAAAFNLGGPGA